MPMQMPGSAPIRPTTPTGTGPVQWEDFGSTFTRRVSFTEVYGDTQSGRTYFAFTAPGPVCLLHATEKIPGVVEPFVAAGKVIRGFNFGGTFRGTAREIADQARRNWDGFVAAFYDGLTWARTIVVDTHTELWELLRIAEFGDVKPDGGRVDTNYGKINGEWKNLFREFRFQDRTNLILIGQTADEWVSSPGGKQDKRSGKTVRATHQRQVPYMADVILRTRFEVGGEEEGERRFSVTIEKAWMNADAMGMELRGKRASWPSVMAQVTKTERGEWVK